MQALAFPFDLHVLSTPPAFILSQDQTLHKKRFRKKQAVKSPNPTKNKPTNTQTGAGLAKIQKLQGSTTDPNPTGL